MNTINQKEYDNWKSKQKDAYSKEVFAFAERWANVMEEKMSEGKKLIDIAEQASFDVSNGITGFMYGAAVSILSKCWIHGELLRQWHNLDTQIGNEGESANKNGGVLNPAIMHFSRD